MKKSNSILLLLILLIIIFLQSLDSQAQSIPRPEYPRPQFQRADWINLNGIWTYTFDFGKSGYERDFKKSKGFSNKINVPFCPESKLSGVEYKDFINAMWYHRQIEIPADWKSKIILLNFGAADYKCEVFIDGESVGKHWGSSSSFYFDITGFVKAGSKHELVVSIEDDLRSRLQPLGKQSNLYQPEGCIYTRTTGIWQTVWLEAVSPIGLESCLITSDFDQSHFIVRPSFFSISEGQKFRCTLFDGNKKIKTVETKAGSQTYLAIPVDKPKPWSPESPFLYDFIFEVISKEGEAADKVTSYAGLRKIEVQGGKVFLNNKPLFIRFVLDQGYYPDGILTAPSDEALKNDIELSLKAGFNGARLHQKVFEERFHYWADKLGYLTWGEFPSWGLNVNDPAAARNFINEWSEVVTRDRNHPSIIAWTPFNETYWGAQKAERENWEIIKEQHDRLLTDVYLLTKKLDPTRPVNETSGFVHVKTDLWTVHNYDQNAQSLREWLNPSDKQVSINYPRLEVKYSGQPYIVDEYGGIKWISSEQKRYSDKSWGYGNEPKDIEEYYKRLEDLTESLLNTEHVAGYCYTQLYDIEQEQNGIYNYDRTEKFDMSRINKIFSRNGKLLSAKK